MKKQGKAKTRKPAGGLLSFTARPMSAPAIDARLKASSVQRANWMVALLSLGLVLLGLRAGYVMAVPNETLERQGREQFMATKDLKGRRGSLLDRKGRPIAVTVSLPTLYANPHQLMLIADPTLDKNNSERAVKLGPHPEIRDACLQKIAKLLEQPVAAVEERFNRRSTDGGYRKEIKLGEALNPDGVKEVLECVPKEILKKQEHPVVWAKESTVRLYPNKELAAPLIGFTNAQDGGAAGLEKVLNRELAGDVYRVLQEQDRKGRSVDAGAVSHRMAPSGRNIRLTLDLAIQHQAEVALMAAIEESRPEAAMVVVEDVRTGAILAMASWPSANPNHMAARQDQEVFKNHAAMDQIEPGSVMKPFVAAAAIEEGLVTPDTMIDCKLGAWPIDGRTIHDDHPKGVITVSDVIKFSSNIGTAQLAFKLGSDKTLTYLKAFGFGRPTTLALPGEVQGILRSPANIKPIELATTSFGQGVTSSPIQLVAAAAALANGGVRMYPYLVDAILDRYGEIETLREPRVDRTVISDDTARQVLRMMESVTDEGGTGTRARVPGYRVAGKTGTAQKAENGGYSSTKRVSSFLGMLPADRPEVVISVTVDSPSIGSRYGGIVAAPVFAKLGSFIMQYMGIAPDPTLLAEAQGDTPAPASLSPSPKNPTKDGNPSFPSEGEQDKEEAVAGAVVLRPDGRGGWIMPDLRDLSMRAVLAGLQPAGFALQVEGQGRLMSQAPLPGVSVAPGAQIKLVFR